LAGCIFSAVKIIHAGGRAELPQPIAKEETAAFSFNLKAESAIRNEPICGAVCGCSGALFFGITGRNALSADVVRSCKGIFGADSPHAVTLFCDVTDTFSLATEGVDWGHNVCGTIWRDAVT
jgi:hypothetical protein